MKYPRLTLRGETAVQVRADIGSAFSNRSRRRTSWLIRWCRRRSSGWTRHTGMIPDSRKSTRTAELVGRQSMRLLAHCRLNWASSPLPITSVLPPSGYSSSGIRMGCGSRQLRTRALPTCIPSFRGRCGARATPLVATSHSISTTEQVPRSGSLRLIWA